MSSDRQRRIAPVLVVGQVLLLGAICLLPRMTAAAEAIPPLFALSDPALTACPPPPACPGVRPPPAMTVDYNVFTEDTRWWSYVGAAGLTVASNVVMWGAVRVTGAEYAKINLSSWKRNFTVGWEWDRDRFSTNQFRHPLQGGVYFSSARLFGLNFWESVPYAVFGSWQWEMFMERELPSFNDIVTTSFGGVFFGEALWRLSNAVLDDTTRGMERAMREIAGFAINPVNGLGRLVSGKSWQRGNAPLRSPIDGLLKFGYVSSNVDGVAERLKLFRFRLELDYGDLLRTADLTTPFSYFTFTLGFNFDTEGVPGKTFEGTGLLYGWRLPIGPNVPTTIAILQHFDYWNQPILESGYSSIGVGWDGEWTINKRWYLNWRLHLLGAFLGGVTSEFARQYSGRSYNLGPGVQSISGLRAGHRRWGFIKLENRRNIMAVASGASGWELTGLFTSELFIHLLGGVGAGAEYSLVNRNGLYNDHPDINSVYHIFSLNIVSTF